MFFTVVYSRYRLEFSDTFYISFFWLEKAFTKKNRNGMRIQDFLVASYKEEENNFDNFCLPSPFFFTIKYNGLPQAWSE